MDGRVGLRLSLSIPGLLILIYKGTRSVPFRASVQSHVTIDLCSEYTHQQMCHEVTLHCKAI
jgi:hypothetical protein